MAPGENNKTAMDLVTTQEEDSSTFTDKAPRSDKSGTHSELEDCSDEPDESLSERLWGLTEMFPESVRNATYDITTKSSSGLKTFYGLSRNIVWIFVTSSVILFAPLIFEVERGQMEDVQRSQQKQMLLGPNTSMAGSGHGVPMPPMQQR